MIAAVEEIFYVRGPRDLPWAVRGATLAVLVGAIAASLWLVTRGTVAALVGGAALGSVGAGAFALFLRSLRRVRWIRLDDQGVSTDEGRSLAYREIDRVTAEDDTKLGRVLHLQSPRADLRIPLFRSGRDVLLNLPLFLALLEERMGKPRGSIARSAREGGAR